MDRSPPDGRNRDTIRSMTNRKMVKGKYGLVDVSPLPSGRINVFAALLERGHQAGESHMGADLTRSEVRRLIAALEASL